MSGGSYNYLYGAGSEDILDRVGCLGSMAKRLAGLGYAPDGARETTELLLLIRQFEVRAQTIIDRLSPVWKAVEWWDSCDWGEEDVKKALAKYRGEDEKGV